MPAPSPFATLEASFRLLCAGPSPLAVDGREVGPPPPRRPVSLDPQRVVLYDEHDALRHHREDPLVLGQETSEGVLARSGHAHAVAIRTTGQARAHPAVVLALNVAGRPPHAQPWCRSTGRRCCLH